MVVVVCYSYLLSFIVVCCRIKFAFYLHLVFRGCYFVFERQFNY